MNKYSSYLESFRARNVYETTISPPNDLTLDAASFVGQVLNRRRNFISPNSTIFLHGLGVFCNFADGLVLKNANTRIPLDVLVVSYTRGTAQNGVGQFSANNKNVTVTDSSLFTPGLPVILDRLRQLNDHDVEYNICTGITDATTITVADYPLYSASATSRVYPLAVAGTLNTNFQTTDARELNYMYSRNAFFSPVQILSAAVTEVVMFVSPVLVPNDVVFLTKSVSTDFDGDALHVDVIGEVEYTRRTAAEQAA